MGSVPILKPGEVVAILVNLGFSEVRQRGSHNQFRDATGRGRQHGGCTVNLPNHT